MGARTEPCAAVDIEFVARWIIDNGDFAPRPLLPTIRREFRMSLADAVAAIRRAAEIRKAAAGRVGSQERRHTAANSLIG